MELNETWQEVRSQRPLPSMCVSDRSKKRWPPLPLIDWDILDISSETAKRNSTKIDRKQDLNVLYQFVFFGLIRKNKMDTHETCSTPPVWNRWTEFIKTSQKARSTSSIQFVFLGPSENQDGRPATDWLRHFRLLLWKFATEGMKNSTSSTKCVFFSDRSEKNRHRCLWLVETCLTSALKPQNRIQRNLTGSKI